ncbi:hypothetical protein LR48_Vigan01g091300 [Vigna angularis]|uniref:Uncharacterized protein n=1 Tax=Phaseolus angularis TaxID=3914 RepID=A0A0L9TL95_PHAAN|nr:hypothetical protein LR48_Vigan01g091300 [Vigna angularis]
MEEAKEKSHTAASKEKLKHDEWFIHLQTSPHKNIKQGCAKERESSRGGSVVTDKGGPMNGVLKIGGVAAASWFFGGSVVLAMDNDVILENVVGEEDFAVKMENVGGSVVVR